MARRSIFVAIAALAAALVPAAAQAATPNVTSNDFVTPVTLSWTPGRCHHANPVPSTRNLFDAAHAGSDRHLDHHRVPGFANSFSDSPGEGRFCYYIQNDALGFGNTAQAVVDTVDPTATIAVTPFGRAELPARHGQRHVDERRRRFGRRLERAARRGRRRLRGRAGNPRRLGHDRRRRRHLRRLQRRHRPRHAHRDCHHHGRRRQHRSDRRRRRSRGRSDRRGRHGRAVHRRGRCHCRHPQRAVALAVDAGAQHNIGAPVTAATGGWARVWNTSTVAVNQRPPDGAVTISALVTDMAGNVLTITTPAVVDNTAPDVKAVLTAPPAVAGSPTLDLDAGPRRRRHHAL